MRTNDKIDETNSSDTFPNYKYYWLLDQIVS